MAPTSEGSIWYRRPITGAPTMIFVHGRQSNSRDCWTSTVGPVPIFWPELVKTEPGLEDWGILLGSYHADDGPGTGISGCSDELFRSLDSIDGSPLSSETLVIVAHSLGGIVTRKILVDRRERFVEKDIFLLLLASPSTGAGFSKTMARVLLTFFGLFRDRTLSRQLTYDHDLIRDLDVNFKRLRNPDDERFMPRMNGAEMSETAFAFKTPSIGRIVDHWSTQHYFPQPRELTGEDHSTICRPSNRGKAVHQLLVSACKSLYTKPPDRSWPRDLDALASLLQQRFNSRYEPPAAGGLIKPVVYWPVRLRSPSPIHAQQSFLAASLIKSGLDVHLWIDDLGTQEYAAETFEKWIRARLSSVAVDAASLTVSRFSDRLSAEDVHHQAWVLTQKWLGDTHQNLGEVLRLAKLVRPSGDQELDQLLARRPRRLLTPPIVWLGLRLLAAEADGVMTLGGLDEVPLWSAWRDLGIDPRIQVGHLYGASLRTRSNDGNPQDLHMRTKPLAWASRDDIVQAFDDIGFKASDVASRGDLPRWSLEQCVFLPQWVSGQYPEVTIGNFVCRSPEELAGFKDDEVKSVLVSALSRHLLGGERR